MIDIFYEPISSSKHGIGVKLISLITGNISSVVKIWTKENAAKGILVATVNTKVKFPIYSGNIYWIATCAFCYHIGSKCLCTGNLTLQSRHGICISFEHVAAWTVPWLRFTKKKTYF